MRVDHLKLSARRYNGTYACHMATDQPSGRGLHRRFRQSFSLRIFRTQRSLFLARSFDIVYDFRYRPLSEMFFVANIILFSFFAHGDWEQWYACDNVKSSWNDAFGVRPKRTEFNCFFFNYFELAIHRFFTHSTSAIPKSSLQSAPSASRFVIDKLKIPNRRDDEKINWN